MNEYSVEVKDEATFVEALAMVDKQIMDGSKKSPFPISDGIIHSYLQLFFDPKRNVIYEDCGIHAYNPGKKFNPLAENVDFNLYPDTKIVIHPDSGC
ncbi:MAG: hypothetical protein EU551_04055 [Promethearchaeota archaeon]|nr:MAG: hypothetical protein EU551_04055 [Candidatus Lokiarchaeota archaeon]